MTPILVVEDESKAIETLSRLLGTEGLDGSRAHELSVKILELFRERDSEDTRVERVELGGVTLLPRQRRILKGDGQELKLFRREYDLLLVLARAGGDAVSRDSLFAALGIKGESASRTLDSHVSHLRARLRRADIVDLVITTVYGVGYRLDRRDSQSVSR